jgi:O-methyltransferase
MNLVEEDRWLRDKICPVYTMARHDQIAVMTDLARRTNAENIPGDMVECGVWNGGSAAILAYFAKQSNFNRTTWLFDSFEGLPDPTVEDGPEAKEISKFVSAMENAEKALSLVNADMSKIRMVKGWFKDTLPTVEIPQIAMLNMDSDFYESEKLVIEKFYDSMVPGGFIYMDDFYAPHLPGCHKAIAEFFESRGEIPIFHVISEGENCPPQWKTSAWIQKGAK